MSTLPPHSHPIDGRLHDDCPHCATIVDRQHLANMDQRRDEALARHQTVATRNRLWRWLTQRDQR